MANFHSHEVAIRRRLAHVVNEQMILDAMVARAVAIERVHERNFDDLLHGQIPPENLGRVKGMPPLAEVEYLDNSEVA